MPQTIRLLSLALAAVFTLPTAAHSQWYYSGPHRGELRHLLTQVPGWRLTSCSDCTNPDYKTPPLELESSSQRDMYVGAAVLYAWAAESHAFLGENAKADEEVAQMMENLRSANALCSNVLDLGGPRSNTLHIWGCPPPDVSAFEALPASPPRASGSGAGVGQMAGLTSGGASTPIAGAWEPDETDSAMKVFREAAEEAVRRNPTQLSPEENEALVAGATIVGGVVDLFSGGSKEDAAEDVAARNAATLQSGEASLRARDYETAESLYSQVLERSPFDVNALVGRGRARLSQGNVWGAIPDLRGALLAGEDAMLDGLAIAYRSAAQDRGSVQRFELLGKSFGETADIQHAGIRGFWVATLFGAAGVGLGYLSGEETCSSQPTLCETDEEKAGTINESMLYFGLAATGISFLAAGAAAPDAAVPDFDRSAMARIPSSHRVAFERGYTAALNPRLSGGTIKGWLFGAVLSGGLIYLLTSQ